MSFDIRGSAVTSKAEQYRAKAAACDERAASIRYVKIKAQCQALVRQWREVFPKTLDLGFCVFLLFGLVCNLQHAIALSGYLGRPANGRTLYLRNRDPSPELCS
jgi:hypothetical protein